MTIADLFINLGIKGEEQSVQQIKQVDGGLKDIFSSGVAAKAMLVAVAAGLQHMMSGAAAAGLGLKQFSNYTGMSTDALQRWQYFFVKNKVDADEVASSMVNLQKIMFAWSRGAPPPVGLKTLVDTLRLSRDDISKLKDANFLMGKLREYSKTEKNPALRNYTMESFGLGPNAVGAMATSNMDLSKIDKRHIRSEGQINSLAKVSEGFTDIEVKIKDAFANFTAKHGNEIVQGLDLITTKVIKLVESFTVLAEKLKVFQVLGTVFEGWGKIFDVAAGAVDYTKDAFDFKKGGGNEKRALEMRQLYKDIWGTLSQGVQGVIGEARVGVGLDATTGPKASDALGKGSLPKADRKLPDQGSNTNINVKQELVFQGNGENSQEVSRAHERAVAMAYRQSIAQGLVT